MHKLDAIDRKLLLELDKNSRSADTWLAKRIGRSREAVRYRIKQLQDKGVIRNFVTIVDLSQFGYQAYSLYATVRGKTEERDKFYNHLKKQHNIFWFAVSEGAWDVGMYILARSNKDFLQQKISLLSKYRHLILNKEISVLADLRIYPQKYLLPSDAEPVILFNQLSSEKIDQTDFKVLGGLLKNARSNLVELARTTALSIDVIRGRMKKMEKKKIILKYSIDLNHMALGLQYFKVFINFDNPTSAQESRFLQYCKERKEIISFARVAASWDAEIGVIVDSFQKFNEFIRTIKDEFSDLIIDTEAATVSEEYLLKDILQFG
ncbi:Lrp/AsnC family transcriptional regulator [Candidatus Woesearchaeota archaeon]|nr:Lrp/AsnC family transcriptional regulator [Candidatus Woesearchaeota archaeon]